MLLRGWSTTKYFYQYDPFYYTPILALVTPFPKIPFTNEEATGATNEAAISANKAPRNPPSCFLFHVLLFQ